MSAIRTNIFYSILFCFILSIAEAQPPQRLLLHELSQRTGLSENINTFAFQDSKGFMWVSSMDGLNRFDGNSVKIYKASKQTNALLSNNILSPFFEDAKGRIWFSTTEAVCAYSHKTDDFKNYFLKDENGQPLQKGYHVFHLSGNLLWVRVESKIYTFNIDTYICTPQNLSTAQIWFKARNDANGNLEQFFSYYNSLGFTHFKRKGGKWETQEFLTDTQNGAYIRDLYILNDTLLLLALDAGLGHYNLRTKKLKLDSIFGKKRLLNLRTFLPIDENNILITNTEGVFKYTLKLPKTGVTLSEITVMGDYFKNKWRAYKDTSDNFWFLSYGKGIHYGSLKKNKFQIVPTNTTTQSRVVGMVEDAQKNIWISHADGGIDRFNWAQNRREHHILNIDKTTINQSNGIYNAATKDGNLIVQATQGLHQFSFDRNRFVKEPIQNANNFNLNGFFPINSSFAFFKQYRRTAGLGRWTGKQWQLDTTHFGGQLPNVKFVFYDDAKANWGIVNEKTVHYYQFDETIKAFKFIKKWVLDDNLVSGSFSVDGKSIWIGTNHKLLKISLLNESLQTYSTEAGIPNTMINCVQQDANSDLWLATTQGLVLFSEAQQKCRVFTTSDGLLSDECLENSLLKTVDGTFYIATTEGVNSFRPENMKDLSTQPRVHIVGLRVNDEPYKPPVNIVELQELTLPYTQRTVSFDFVAIEFSDPKKNKLAFKLDGLDNHWLQSADAKGFARYANLEAGTYTFMIRGYNSDGVGGAEIRRLRITILPPFWQTWWFRGLMLLLLSSIAWALVREYAKRKLREQLILIENERALQNERNRIANELHDDLGGGLSTIRLLGERALGGVMQPDKRQQIEKITSQAAKLVEKMATIIWAMNSRNDSIKGLVNYFRQYANDFLYETHDINCRFPLPDFDPSVWEITLTGKTRRESFLAFEEALTNIVKYAKTDVVDIDIQLTVNGLEQYLDIKVKDNGVGIQREKPTCNGLKNMAERMTAIGGKLSFNSSDTEGVVIVFSLPTNKS